MKRITRILMVLLAGAGIMACESLQLGDAGLSKAPETSGATIDTLTATLKDADKILVTAYAYLPYGLVCDFDSKLGGNVLESITDFQYSNVGFGYDGPRNLYYNGSLGAVIPSNYEGSINYRFGSESDYTVIRYAWQFIENAPKVKDADPGELRKKIAEAKVCIAIAYANMFRYVGGVPWLDHSVDPNEDMHYPRLTFAETVDHIVALLDEAKADLPWYNTSANDDGRMTRAAALGLKLRVLCFAASPTFNSDTKWHPEADEYTCYGNYDKERWKRAKDAADEFMTELAAGGHYALVQAEEVSNMGYRLAYRKGYFNRGTSESIISVRKSYSSSYHSDWIGKAQYLCPTLNWVCMYGWEDGKPFVDDPDHPETFNWKNPPTQPFFKPNGTQVPGVPTRDPRLYENIAVPGDLWKDGTVARLHTNHPYYSAGGTGFLVSKFVLQQASDRDNIPPHWPLMRYAEVLLNAAEAYNEYDGAPSAKAYGWVNEVRSRVGLGGLAEGMTQEQFRKALLRERGCEFGNEEVRWFDLIRYGLVSDFQKPLYGLSSKGVDNDNNPTTFTFKITEVPSRAWQTDWSTKWYLAPIPLTEVNKGYGMTQNPGWK